VGLKTPDMLKTSNLVKSTVDEPGEVPAKSKAVKQERSAPALTEGLTRQLSRAMFQQGLSVDEIAQRRNLTRGTIITHLTEVLEAGESIDIDRLIAPERYEIIAEVLRRIGDGLLRPVKDELGDDYSYDEIRLVRAAMRVLP
jgi:ATP-dependent DNA helicase RecQ